MALLAVAACDYPTEPPRWEQTWVVPGDSFAIGVSQLLPPTLALNDDGTAFLAPVPSTSIVVTLGTVCGSPCQTADGLVVPKPPFTRTLTATTALPEEIVTATLAGGSFDFRIAHDLGFDPLRPAADPAAERGYLLVRVTSDGVVVARDSIDGDDRAFPPGTTITPTLPVVPAQVGGVLDLALTIHSPAGDPVEIDAADTMAVSLAPSTLEISQATIAVGTVDLPTIRAPLRLGRLQDPAVLDAVRRGALRLAVHNPFAVTGSLEIVLDLDGSTVQRSLPVREGDYVERLEFSGSEVRDLLTSPAVAMEATGSLAVSGGTLVLNPTQRLVLDATIELIVGIGGGGG